MYNSLLSTNGYGYNSFGSSYGSYGGYGGFSGYGGYGNVGSVEAAKTNIKNQYDVYSARQSYGNMQNIEGMNYAQRSNVIGEMLRDGRSDDAMKQFNVLCGELKASGMYGEYSNTQIRAVAQQIYQNSTGENLAEAIKGTTDGAFAKGFQNGLTIFGLFGSGQTSKEEMLSEINGTKVTWEDKVGKAAGAGIGAGVTIGAGVALAKTGLLSTVGSALWGLISAHPAITALAVVGIAASAVATALKNK